MNRFTFRELLLTLVLMISFTSCMEDDYDATVGGELNADARTTTDDTGYFSQNYLYNAKDFMLSEEYNSVHNVHYIGTKIEISAYVLEDCIFTDLVLEITDIGKFSLPGHELKTGSDTLVYDTKDNVTLYNFMERAFDRLNRYNQLNMSVSGRLKDTKGNAIGNIPVKIRVINSVDADVSH